MQTEGVIASFLYWSGSSSDEVEPLAAVQGYMLTNDPGAKGRGLKVMANQTSSDQKDSANTDSCSL